MRHFLYAIGLLLLLTGCRTDDEEDTTPGRAVLIYMAANNNLGSGGFARTDLREIMAGSVKVTGNDRIYVLYDRYSSTEPPCIYEVAEGDTLRRYTFETGTQTSNAATLRRALDWMIQQQDYADNYGLVLWGHCTGWTFENGASSRRRNAYGVSYDNNVAKWMDIDAMGQALEGMPRLEFILADCCAFQCVETAYELRHAADYIIGSPAEIPSEGAPYAALVPALFADKSQLCATIIDTYFQQVISNYKVPLSAVKTSELESLAAATRNTLRASVNSGEYPDVSGLIYYFDHTNFDMNDFMLRHASAEDYASWHQVFEKAVVYSSFTPTWMTDQNNPHVNFNDFTATEERYGGLSMFVLQEPTTKAIAKQNQNISRTQWYTAAGLGEIGW